ncbi:hypothetical protein GIB67_012812 [Kingdonia uniflora]|uniref:poly(A)-specific ribonuclease n=1 Tax=Kingdonia uniflora TaxID=39325 RepID=A0A7J7NFF2_9MAGN|nr:hypothetical protein GIB67_012812 [Kingdonia uniflora]
MLEIEMITKKYPYCAFDTEFPGFLRSSPRDAFQDVRYEDLKFNVDRLKLIQIGFSFSDENGNTPPVSTYQFNFNDFDLRKDAYVSVSIDLLTRNGIDMAKNLREGVDPGIFSGWFTQILIRNPNMKWITFHGLYDLGYLMKTLMRNTPLPSSLDIDEEQFKEKSDWITQMGWYLLTDGSTGPAGSGINIFLITPSIIELKAIKLNFKATNNKTEYEVLINSLDIALEIRFSELFVYTGSFLIVNHYMEKFQKNGKMIDYAVAVADRMSRFKKATIKHLPRRESRHSDSLAYLVGVLGTEARYLKIKVISTPSIYIISSNSANAEDVEENEDDYRRPFLTYIGPQNKFDVELPKDPTERRCVLDNTK